MTLLLGLDTFSPQVSWLSAQLTLNWVSPTLVENVSEDGELFDLVHMRPKISIPQIGGVELWTRSEEYLICM